MIKQFVTSKFCLSCHRCCRFTQKDSVWLPHLLDEEIHNLQKKDIFSSFISPEKKFIPQPFLEKEIFVCPFLKLKDNKCKIYAIRSFECRLYPFLINYKGKKFFLAVDLYCPYVKQHLKSKKFKRYSEYLISYLKIPSFKSILKNNPQIIHTYPKVLNLKPLDFN